jgi:glycosyltransferase involved in cell wall biosynthesis
MNHEVKEDVMGASYGSVLNDPPSRNCVSELIRHGASVTAVHRPFHSLEEIPIPGLKECRVSPILPGLPRQLRSLFELAAFRRRLRREIRAVSPQLFVSIMFHPIALARDLPENCRLIVGILDIPPCGRSGALTEKIVARAWRRLKKADLVWASDIYKAKRAMGLGDLREEPIVCHNCPPLSYLHEFTWPRDHWLREQLHAAGANLTHTGGCIILRAGAIGPCGGIEETLAAMEDLPSDYVFLMVGRPSSSYKEHLLSLIEKNGLAKRAFLWDRPDMHTWKRALQGADVGHLIHGPFVDAYDQEIYKLNSSLSNNRLFQYMAAGLPIIAYNDPRMAHLYKEVDCFRVANLDALEGDLRTILKELGADPNARQPLGARAREAHLRKYNWENQFAPVLAKIVKTKRTFQNTTL